MAHRHRSKDSPIFHYVSFLLDKHTMAMLIIFLQGMKLISLDSKEKAEHFLGLVGRDRAPYFWTGGQISADSRTLR